MLEIWIKRDSSIRVNKEPLYLKKTLVWGWPSQIGQFIDL